jgi:hypothetical protein
MQVHNYDQITPPPNFITKLRPVSVTKSIAGDYHTYQEEQSTKENVGELYSKANPNTVSFVIKRVDANGQAVGHPYLIPKRNYSKIQRDRSYGDILEGSHTQYYY